MTEGAQFPVSPIAQGDFQVPVYNCPICGAAGVNTPLHPDGPHLVDGRVITRWFCPKDSWLPPEGLPPRYYMRQSDVDTFEEARLQKQIRHELGYDRL